jgi:hypothetical protein
MTLIAAVAIVKCTFLVAREQSPPRWVAIRLLYFPELFGLA